jgi:hypothetical protein
MGRALEILERLLSEAEAVFECETSSTRYHPMLRMLEEDIETARGDLDRAKLLGETL